MRRVLAVTVGFLVLAAAGAFLYIRTPREVTPGVWRSPQPGMRTIRNLVERHGLRSIINLRGDNPSESWYEVERQAVSRFGLDYAEYRFETFEPPPRTETVSFVDHLISMPRPILVHCRSGLDRSGWASAVARILAGESIDDALDEMKPWRGHICDRDSCPLHGFFDQYRQWLQRNERTNSPVAFIEWIHDDYAPELYDARITIISQPSGPVPPGGTLRYQIEVRNVSSRRWTAGEERTKGIRLGARIIGPWEGQRPRNAYRMFRKYHSPSIDIYRSGDRDLDPGQTARFDVEIEAPAEPGGYTIQFDMVEEHVGWFSEWAWPGAISDFLVARHDVTTKAP